MSAKRKAVFVAGVILMLASGVGHIWHKYFTATGASPSDHFRDYASHHWYFWLGILLGAALVWLGGRSHPTKSLHSTPR